MPSMFSLVSASALAPVLALAALSPLASSQVPDGFAVVSSFTTPGLGGSGGLYLASTGGGTFAPITNLPAALTCGATCGANTVLRRPADGALIVGTVGSGPIALHVLTLAGTKVATSTAIVLGSPASGLAGVNQCALLASGGVLIGTTGLAPSGPLGGHTLGIVDLISGNVVGVPTTPMLTWVNALVVDPPTTTAYVAETSTGTANSVVYAVALPAGGVMRQVAVLPNLQVNGLTQPDRLVLALRGSGQALYVGLAEDRYVVASEPYGVVEETDRYLRMDGETPGNPANADASRGQVLALDAAHAGELTGISRVAYDGTELPVAEADLQRAAITTRDIDRGSFPHFLLKEITEAPRSFHKTLRGKIVEAHGRLRVALGDDVLPPALRAKLRRGDIRRILIIGQGTAAVAGQGTAAAFDGCLGAADVAVRALPATELSGFAMREEMRDTLVVAISQSGTTTDTNRTVDLVRQRGATVVAIVNRRGSDLCDKADGVLFTSDGRDVEMSVASTKAFYAQIAAGFLLALAVARELDHGDDRLEHEILGGLRQLPAAMGEVLAQAAHIGEVARRHVPGRRYWALVGNGANKVAAQEIRIKLSELCYKAIPCDATEDKKHIDLSSEPLIVVCAAGLAGSTADDVGKEVAIYKAHKATPIVIATAGEDRFRAAVDTIHVPAVHPRLAFVLATVAGHLFGYHAALAIDATARPLRAARGAIEALVATLARDDRRSSDELLAELAPALRPHAQEFFRLLATRAYDGTLEAATATRLGSDLRFALGELPLEAYEACHGRSGTPATVIEDLTEALTRAIEELTRPVDAIKHQAKTVTVGISRSDEALLTVPAVQALLATGTPRDRVRYADLRTLAALDPAVRAVLGHTRYRIEGDADGDTAIVQVVGRGGIAKEIPSRTDRQPLLRGTKHSVARRRRLQVARGASDGRTVILVPEVQGNRTVGVTLLHVAFHGRRPPASMRGVLHGYHDRLAELRDAVMETDTEFAEDRLGELPVADLLCEPVRTLAAAWR